MSTLRLPGALLFMVAAVTAAAPGGESGGGATAGPACPGSGNCYLDNGTPGCSDATCCTTVCELIPPCCDLAWDLLCADQAFELCGPPSVCSDPAAGDCCAVDGTAGCNDPACCQVICAVDEYCCDFEWDALCVVAATTHCPDLGCAVPACGHPAAGDCCVVSRTPGCDDALCCDAVCAADPHCCVDAWDELCVSSAQTLCEACEGPPSACGDPAAGDCCAESETASCNDPACCDAVCVVDAYCCVESWDAACVDRAEQVCVMCAGGPTPCPWDLDGDNAVGIVDFLALLAAWGPNPGHPADFDGDLVVGINDFLDLLANWGTCAAAACTVNLVIHKGQSGSALSESDEETQGSFTVANLNDTDCDGIVDNADTSVKDAGNDGEDEVDLMKLILKGKGPKTKSVELSLVSGAARVWEQETKEVEVTLPKKYSITELPKRLWVEATAPSAALRDIELKLVCQEWGVEDVVNATGVWATVTAVSHDRVTAADLLADPEWADMTGRPSGLINKFDGTGLTPITGDGARNVIAIKFTITPPGVYDENRPAFDGSRRKEGKTWTRNGNSPCVLDDDGTSEFPDRCDEANDDRNSTDKSLAPNDQDEYFDVDIPGAGELKAHHDLLIRRLNFMEFLRMKCNGTRPRGKHSGSRCSPFYDWHMRQRLLKGPDGNWIRSGGDDPETADNDVGPGHIDLGTCP